SIIPTPIIPLYPENEIQSINRNYLIKTEDRLGENTPLGECSGEQGTVLTVWISSIFQIQQRKMHLYGNKPFKK
ncbi:MAG: hypothetical protein ACK5P3_10805, partial [Dolichospermum sp.]